MDYRLDADPGRLLGDWDRVVRELLLDRWIAAYVDVTPWAPEISEIGLGALVYLFDAAPALTDAAGDDRVVVVWGRSAPPAGPRDRTRLAGFIPVPGSWSARARDRGHLVGHSLGGGLDLNIVPQASALNRGRSSEGRRWRALEREAAARTGTPLFVRPVYDDDSWMAEAFEYGIVRPGGLHVERFRNRV